MGETKHITVDRSSLASVIVVLGGLSQFAINLYIAVTSFGGGYSFSEDFLSDLGRTTKPSAPYFNSGVIMLGLSLAAFFANSARHEDKRRFGIAGIVSAFGLAGIGMTPLDRYFLSHHFFLVMWLLPMFVMIFYSIQIFGGANRMLIVAAGLALSLLISLYIASAGSNSAPFHQKIVVIFAIAWLLLICFHSTFAVVREIVSRSSIGKDSATRAYLQRLEITACTQERADVQAISTQEKILRATITKRVVNALWLPTIFEELIWIVWSLTLIEHFRHEAY